MTYRRIIVTKHGGPEVLEFVEVATLPEPKDMEVRVRVSKTSACFTDTMIRRGKYPDLKDKPPFSPGYDMVGVIDKLGSNVSSYKVGDKVADLTVTGAYSEYICLPAERLSKYSADLDDSEAVSMVLSYLTAYQMLHRIAKVSKGQRVLIHGASGAVGTALLQLGKLHELEMYGTSSKEKFDIVEKNGGLPIDYKAMDFEKEIMNLTEGNGVDVVFDPIGGANFAKSFRSICKQGMLVAYGFYNSVVGRGGNVPLDFIRLLIWNILPNHKKTYFYSINRERHKHPEWFKADLDSLFDMLAQGLIKPEIYEHMPLSKAVEAHEKLERGEVRGKIILDVN